MPALAMVGLGYRPGKHVTLHGDHLLATSSWIGYFGLSHGLRSWLLSHRAACVDLDQLAHAEKCPRGFTLRAAAAALEASTVFGRAAVAVAGHPSMANPAARAFAAVAEQHGVNFEIAGAPSALDAYAERTGFDAVTSGAVTLDARTLLWRQYTLEPQLTLLLWNAGYLGPEDKHRLTTLLQRTWGANWPIRLYRADQTQATDEFTEYPLARPELWTQLISYDTTLIVPGRGDPLA